jgi:hypothetical protein
VTRFRVALSDVVVSAEGPCLVGDIAQGEAALALDASGALRYAAVKAVSNSDPTPGFRLLTTAGDVVVPSGMCVMTRRGPMAGASLADALDKGMKVSVEVVRLRSVPAWRERPVPGRSGLEAACAALPHLAISWPAPLCDEADVDRRLAELLRSVGWTFTRHANERWRCLDLERTKRAATRVRGAYKTQLELLTCATAWARYEDGDYDLRTRDGDRCTRQALLLAALGAGEEAVVTWTPSYCPIEAHMRLTTTETTTFATVTCCRAESHPAATLHLEGCRQLVVGTLMLMPHAGGGS